MWVNYLYHCFDLEVLILMSTDQITNVVFSRP